MTEKMDYRLSRFLLVLGKEIEEEENLNDDL
jgi:hypothetical protein